MSGSRKAETLKEGLVAAVKNGDLVQLFSLLIVLLCVSNGVFPALILFFSFELSLMMFSPGGLLLLVFSVSFPSALLTYFDFAKNV